MIFSCGRVFGFVSFFSTLLTHQITDISSMVVIFSIILSAYCLLVLVLLAGWVIVRRRKIPTASPAVAGVLHQQPRISIIVAMRNESSNIEDLYRDLSSMAYAADKFEIILVND